MMIKTLIVDDEPWTREVIKQFGLWEQYDMKVIGEADNGLEAIELIKLHHPQLVITDMRMPGVDGVELLRYLNENYGEEIKIIVISGHDDFIYTRQAIRSKVNEYLLKPIDPGELNAALKKCREEIAARLELLIPGSLDRNVLNVIKESKKKISAFLNEGKRDALQSAFEELYNQLHHLERSNEMKSRVYQEFLRMWEDTVILNHLDMQELHTVEKANPLATWRSTVDTLRMLYESAVDKLLEQRKYRNKLNLYEVKQYIENHFTESISLESISKIFFVSKEYLSRVFKHEFGLNVSDYILHLRMEKAKELLIHDKLSIKAIAEMVGYEDVAYFYRIFKKHFGVTPGEMRKSLKE